MQRDLFQSMNSCTLSQYPFCCLCVCARVCAMISHDVVHYVWVKSCGVMVGVGCWIVACQVISQTHKPVSVLGFYSTVALLSQGHETPAPPGVSSCICEELLGSAWVLTTDLCFFLCLVLLFLQLFTFLPSAPSLTSSLDKMELFFFSFLLACC